MRLRTSLRAAAVAAVAVAAAGLSAAPAQASGPASTCTGAAGTVCFADSIWFNGKFAEYKVSAATGCVNTPITIHGWINSSDRTLLVYPGANCTGTPVTVPPSDFHSYSSPLRSFRTA